MGRLVCRNCDFPYNDADIRDSDFFWQKDLPDTPKCGKTDAECSYPDSLERRADRSAFEKRYQTYLDTETKVIDFLSEYYSVTDIEIKGG